MAKRRMFSLDIVDSDAFLDMPQSTQCLYFHLAMRADDDGFVNNAKKIMRMVSSAEDDYKVLLTKRFLIPFETGVCVIKHWKMHNYIRKDTYTETKYLDEKKNLKTKENGSYTETRGRLVDDSLTQVRLGKVREGKVSIDCEQSSGTNKVFQVFYDSINPSINFGNKTSRKSAEWMIEKWGLEKVVSLAEYACSIHGNEFSPVITTPHQLKEKMSQLGAYKKRQENDSSTITVL